MSMSATMATATRNTIALGLFLLCLLSPAIAQSVVPSNASFPSYTVLLAVSNSAQYTFKIANLTIAAGSGVPTFGTQQPLLPVNLTNTYNTTSGQIALVSCDPEDGILQPIDILKHVAGENSDVVILYSNSSDHCSFTPSDSPWRIYTMRRQDAAVLIGANKSTAAIETIPSFDGSGSGGGSNDNNGTTPGTDPRAGAASSPLPPSPSTAVAMVILYAITGVITALFLAIIVTGAVRAHRHPERYGPRSGIGRPRQSRARGLAKAMLDTLPIVRFGEREERGKPSDVELADSAGAHGPVETLAGQDHSLDDNAPHVAARTTTEAADGTAVPKQTIPPFVTQDSETSTSNIAAAETPDPSSSSPGNHDDNNQGCSICTDDFEVGQDQRVLPCDHRFHPACVDPWLLNVSGTCPLCRIDLRPERRFSVDSSSATGDDFLAPPLDSAGDGSTHHRRSARRSTILNILGATHLRPGTMTREQRVAALRELAQARTRQGEPPESGSDEPSMRQRLRNAFRVRTRRVGENGRVEEVVDGSGEENVRSGGAGSGSGSENGNGTGRI